MQEQVEMFGDATSAAPLYGLEVFEVCRLHRAIDRGIQVYRGKVGYTSPDFEAGCSCRWRDTGTRSRSRRTLIKAGAVLGRIGAAWDLFEVGGDQT